MHGEEPPLHEVRLHRQTQPDRHIGLTHGEIELLVDQQQLDADVGKAVEELAEARRQPVGAETDRGRDAQLPVRLLAGIDETRPRGLDLQLHLEGGAKQGLARLGQDEAARMAMEERHADFLLERGDLTAHGRLAQLEHVTRVGETADLGGRAEYSQTIPVHCGTPLDFGDDYSAAVLCCSLAASHFSASSAAMQPSPAAVTACR